MDEQSSNAISRRNNSTIVAAPAGARQVAGAHTTIMIIDEAAHM